MSKRILVADDEPRIVALLQSCFAPKYDVVIARDGEEALHKVHEARPDLVVIDLMLPKMDGYTVGFRLRQEPEFRRLPIILLSGLIERDSGREDAFDFIDFHMGKPFDTGKLLAKVDQLLQDAPVG